MMALGALFKKSLVSCGGGKRGGGGGLLVLQGWSEGY